MPSSCCWIASSQDVMVEILSRLPVKSLMRCRGVCKSWRSLISQDSNFNTFHQNQSIKNDRFSLFCLNDYDGSIFDFPFDDLHHYPIEQHSQSGRKKGKNLDYLPSGSFKISNTSCNGIICYSSVESETEVCLLNPSTRAYKRLPDASPYGLEWDMMDLEIGYRSITREYVVLRVGWSGERSEMLEIQMYTQGTDLWRTVVELPRNNITNYGTYLSPTVFNESFHWLTSKCIVSFDMNNEQINDNMRALPPHTVESQMTDYGSYLSVVGGSFLCLCRQFCTKHIEVWVMEEYGVSDSWTLQFTITPQILHDGNFHVVRYSRQNGDDQILLKNTKGDLVMYDPRSASLRNLVVGDGHDFWGCTITGYVETLAWIDEDNYNNIHTMGSSVDYITSGESKRRRVTRLEAHDSDLISTGNTDHCCSEIKVFDSEIKVFES